MCVCAHIYVCEIIYIYIYIYILVRVNGMCDTFYKQAFNKIDT